MRGRAVLFALLVLSQAAQADALAFQIRPSRNPDDLVTCRIELRTGQIVAIEYKGVGAPPGLIMRWPVRKDEEAAVLHALQALISGDLPGMDPYKTRVPPPPYVMVTWSATVNERLQTGLYLQTGLDLPPVLAGLIGTVLPGGPCYGQLRACCGHFDSGFPRVRICDSLCIWQMLGVIDGQATSYGASSARC